MRLHFRGTPAGGGGGVKEIFRNRMIPIAVQLCCILQSVAGAGQPDANCWFQEV